MKSLLQVLLAILTDVGMVCKTSLKRDQMTIQSRFEHEGESFLTITLPAFSKALFRAIEEGRWTPDMCTAFARQHHVLLPRFLSGLTSLVFDSEGVLLDQPNVEAIDGVRQICLFASKLKRGCSPERERAAEAAFLRTEEEVSLFRPKQWLQRNLYSSVVSVLYGTILSRLENRVRLGDIVPKHGPGATSQKISGNRKFSYKSWTSRLQRTLPIDFFQFVNHNELIESIGETCSLEQLFLTKEPPVRVVFVPKTAKTPRVIAIEPVHMQYVQQGISAPLIEELEKAPWTAGRVNFSKQSINGSLALRSSLDRRLATLDLSEASDRVHSWFAFEIFRRFPSLCSAVFSARSKIAMLPSNRVIRLKKFASMGSALCFPVESMVFYAIIATVRLSTRKLLPTYRNIRDCIKDVYVYGDDLIVPSKEVEDVISGLETAGLKVNRSKSFARSAFRESCGTDAFAGVNVTPVYARHLMPTSRRTATEVASWVATANLLYKKGLWHAAQLARSLIEKAVGTIPHVLATSPLLGWYSFDQKYSVGRWNASLQRFEVKGLRLRPHYEEDKIDGYQALMKYFVYRRTSSVADNLCYLDQPLDPKSYERSVRPGSAYICSQWDTPV